MVGVKTKLVLPMGVVIAPAIELHSWELKDSSPELHLLTLILSEFNPATCSVKRAEIPALEQVWVKLGQGVGLCGSIEQSLSSTT